MPNGRRCSCPDTNVSPTSHKGKTEIVCDAATEPERPRPKICSCQNGGFCRETDTKELLCECLPGYQGQFCDIHTAHSKAGAGANTAAIVVPIIVILLVLGAATGVYFFLRKRPL